MSKEQFRKDLVIAALTGFTSNDFLAQQLAALDLSSQKKIDSLELMSRLAVRVADKVLEQFNSVEAQSSEANAFPTPFEIATTMFQQYLERNTDETLYGYEFRLVVKNVLDGSTSPEFFIHPLNRDGETLDFKVSGNTLECTSRVFKETNDVS